MGRKRKSYKFVKKGKKKNKKGKERGKNIDDLMKYNI